jgi:hypothetical protein
MGPTGCTETSVRIYHYTLRNIPAERKSLLGLLGTESEGASFHLTVGNHAPDIQLATLEEVLSHQQHRWENSEISHLKFRRKTFRDHSAYLT